MITVQIEADRTSYHFLKISSTRHQVLPFEITTRIEPVSLMLFSLHKIIYIVQCVQLLFWERNSIKLIEQQRAKRKGWWRQKKRGGIKQVNSSILLCILLYTQASSARAQGGISMLCQDQASCDALHHSKLQQQENEHFLLRQRQHESLLLITVVAEQQQ